MVLIGRQKTSVLVRLRGWKTCEKTRPLGFGGTVFNSSVRFDNSAEMSVDSARLRRDARKRGERA